MCAFLVECITNSRHSNLRYHGCYKTDTPDDLNEGEFHSLDDCASECRSKQSLYFAISGEFKCHCLYSTFSWGCKSVFRSLGDCISNTKSTVLTFFKMASTNPISMISECLMRNAKLVGLVLGARRKAFRVGEHPFELFTNLKIVVALILECLVCKTFYNLCNQTRHYPAKLKATLISLG